MLCRSYFKASVIWFGGGGWAELPYLLGTTKLAMPLPMIPVKKKIELLWKCHKISDYKLIVLFCFLPN